MSSNTQSQEAHKQLVQQIYTAAAGHIIATGEGVSFEEVLEQSIQAARVYAEQMKISQPNIDDWLGALPGMK